MQTQYEVFASNEEEVWQKIAADLAEDFLEYTAIIKENGVATVLQIDIDPGGGFEGGYAYTSLVAPLTDTSGFKFAIHHEGLLDEVGKFFGMQDVVIGYAEFDKKVVVKTNNEGKVKRIFKDEKSRSPFQNLGNFNMHISHSDDADPQLKLQVEEAIVDAKILKQLYRAFSTVMNALKNDSRSL